MIIFVLENVREQITTSTMKSTNLKWGTKEAQNGPFEFLLNIMSQKKKKKKKTKLLHEIRLKQEKHFKDCLV